MDLKGNTVLITGGTSGIGFELAKQLLALGNTVIITGRDAERLAKAEQKLPGVKTIRSDVGAAKDIEALHAKVMAEHPELNVLVNNAGIMRTLNLHKAEPLESLTREIEINLMGPIRMVAQFLPSLKQRPRAAIVNVSSGLAFVPLPITPVYCATKAALHSYSLSLRVQLKNTKVQVFELAPPTTETELLADFKADDMKGVKMMKVDELVRQCLQGLAGDRLEIRPGQSNQLRFMNRVAPGFIHGQLAKSADGMLKEQQ